LASFSMSSIKVDGSFQSIHISADEQHAKALCGLYRLFFLSKDAEVSHRIQAAAFLFKSTEVVGKEDIALVEGELMAIGKTVTLAENTRADALDMLLRNSRTKAAEAYAILQELGYDTSTKRFKTIYDCSQNVHNESVQASVARAIVSLVSEESVYGIDMETVFKEINTYIEDRPPEIKYAIRKALHRTITDPSTFTDAKITLGQLLCAVYNRIQTFPTSEEYLLRLLQELEEMADTCSSGFAARLVNVLSGSGEYQVVTVSWEDQIKSNIAGRMMKRIRDLPDGASKDDVTMGMMADCEPQEKAAYERFMEQHKSSLYKEMYSEFVDGGYLKHKEFDQVFENNYLPK
jgi:hypothetical protein